MSFSSTTSVPQSSVPMPMFGSSPSSFTQMLELYKQCQSINLTGEQHKMYMERRSLEYTILQEESNKRKSSDSFENSCRVYFENGEKQKVMKTKPEETTEPLQKKPRVYTATIHVGNFGGKLVVKYGMVDTMGLQSNVAKQIVTSFFTTEKEGKAILSKWAEKTDDTTKDLTGRDERMAYALAHHEKDAPILSNRLTAIHQFYKPLCDIATIPEGIQKIRKKGSVPLDETFKKIHKESQLAVKMLLAQFFIDHSEPLDEWYNKASNSFSKTTPQIDMLCQNLNNIFESEDYQKLPQQFQKEDYSNRPHKSPKRC